MELRDYVRVLAKRWLGIVLITLLTVGGVAAYTFTQPKQYTATAQSFIAVSSPTSDGTITPDASYTLQRITSYLRIVQSPQVLQPVIDELGLDVDVDALAGRVTATNPIDTVIIEVSATDEDAARSAAIANAVTAQLTAVIQDLESTAAGEVVPVKATLTRPAEPPPSPSSPRTRVNLILGLLIGLALGVGYAFLRESLDTTVKESGEVADFTGAASLGTVAFDSGARKSPLVALDQGSVRAEAFRAIRTNLQFVDVDHSPQVIAITSALPSEGKSTSALNLAITMAQAGQSVVVVETDLRRPKTGEYLGIETAVGLTDALAGQISLDDALLSWNRGMLTVLAAGRVPPNPSELLSSHRFAAVLADLRERFDMVIVDATPLLPVTDGAIVAHACDGAVLIVRHGKTTRDQLEHATAALDRVGARLLGTVLNFVPTKKRGYGGYGYGYYGYGDSQAPDEGKHRRSRRGSRTEGASEAAGPGADVVPATGRGVTVLAAGSQPAAEAGTPTTGAVEPVESPSTGGDVGHAPPPADAQAEPLPPPGPTSASGAPSGNGTRTDDTAPQPVVRAGTVPGERSSDTVLPGM